MTTGETPFRFARAVGIAPGMAGRRTILGFDTPGRTA